MLLFDSLKKGPKCYSVCSVLHFCFTADDNKYVSSCSSFLSVRSSMRGHVLDSCDLLLLHDTLLLLSLHFNQHPQFCCLYSTTLHFLHHFTLCFCDSSSAFTPGLPDEVIKPLVVCLAVCMCVLYKTQGGICSSYHKPIETAGHEW